MYFRAVNLAFRKPDRILLLRIFRVLRFCYIARQRSAIRRVSAQRCCTQTMSGLPANV